MILFALILLFLWAVGMLTLGGYFIHLLLVVAVCVILVRVIRGERL